MSTSLHIGVYQDNIDWEVTHILKHSFQQLRVLRKSLPKAEQINKNDPTLKSYINFKMQIIIQLDDFKVSSYLVLSTLTI